MGDATAFRTLDRSEAVCFRRTTARPPERCPACGETMPCRRHPEVHADVRKARPAVGAKGSGR